MAHLNVRERRIETTIAYVGSELSGKSTNFEHLRREVREGRAGTLEERAAGDGTIQSFEWRPLQMARFDDCDVMVKLVATHGAVPLSDIHRVLADADGIVVVLDSDPAAADRNLESLAAVKDVLARERRVRPVVLQANKRDLPDAMMADDLVRALDVEWPLVNACATRGEGVVETLRRALTDVIEAMKLKTAEETSVQAPTVSADTRTTAPKVEGNPLLAALRQILQSTVSEHVSALEERLARRLEAKVDELGERFSGLDARVEGMGREIVGREVPTREPESREIPNYDAILQQIADRPDPSFELPPSLVRLPEEVDRMYAEFSQELVRVGRALDQVRSALVDSAQETARAMRSQEAALAKLEGLSNRESEGDDETVERIQSLLEATASRVEEMHVMSLGAPTREDLLALEERARQSSEALSKHDRDHVSAAASVLRRAVEAVGVDARDARSDLKEVKVDVKELKKHDASPTATREFTESIESVSGKADAVIGILEPTAIGVRALPARLDDIEGRLQRDLRAEFARRLAPIDDALRLLQAETATSLHRAEERATALEANLTELITELKQRKKGWFG